MSDALQGLPPREPTIGERANAPRIGRARFIGYTIGISLIFALIAAGLGLLHLTQPLTIITPNGPLTVQVLAPIPALTITVLLDVALLDLIVRRRHDRNRSGIEGLAWLVLSVASLALHLFDQQPMIRPLVDGALGLVSLYLLVVCAVLPGVRGPNRYGEDPRARR